MPRRGPLFWLDGDGWLVLVGGGERGAGDLDAVDAHVLSVTNLDRPMVVLLSEGTSADAEAVLEHFAALGGPGGEAFVLAQMTRGELAAPALLTLLEEAGTLYLGGEDPLPLVRTLYRTPALERIARGFTSLQGLTVIGVGGGAAAMGAWMIDRSGSPVRGFGFVQNSLIVPHFTGAEEAPALRRALRDLPGLLGLGIPDGTALALGPQGQVEMWGEGQVTAVIHTDEGE